MPRAGPALESKSPKAPRRVKTSGGPPSSQPHSNPSRHVHFGDLEQTTAGKSFAEAKDNLNLNDITTSGTSIKVKLAPTPSRTSTPIPTLTPTASVTADQTKATATTTAAAAAATALAPPAGLASSPWFTSQHPAQSVGQLPLHCQLHYQHPVTFVNAAAGVYNQPIMAADYSNATPPVMGVNFQPPVPDTTHGPMNHVYIPRFDGGVVPNSGPPPGMQQQPTIGQVPLQQQYFVQAQPQVHHQPQVQGQTYYINQPPVLVNGQPQMMAAPGPQLQPAPGTFVQAGLHPMCGQQAMPIGGAGIGPSPDVAGLGRTQGEETLRQLNFAHSNRMFESQDFKPSDDDPSRFYYVRELDGNWTQRNRFTIDHMGDCRWYVTDEGWFYAVRLPN